MTFASLVGTLVGLINNIVVMLAGVAMVVFFAGVVQYIYRSPSPKAKTYGRDMIVYGLTALFVMASLWGIISLLQQSFLPS